MLYVSAVTFPWWVTFALAFCLFAIFDRYYELIFLGLLFDILYGDRFIISIITILLYIVLNSFKKYIRSYV